MRRMSIINSGIDLAHLTKLVFTYLFPSERQQGKRGV